MCVHVHVCNFFILSSEHPEMILEYWSGKKESQKVSWLTYCFSYHHGNLVMDHRKPCHDQKQYSEG